jgi:hypothetical protein
MYMTNVIYELIIEKLGIVMLVTAGKPILYALLMVMIISVSYNIASLAMLASAEINLLQNSGFESGILDPWVTGASGGGWEFNVPTFGHTGSYSAGTMYNEEGEAWILQEIRPQCARYLEFWYHGGKAGTGGDMRFGIYYSDGTEYWEDLNLAPPGTSPEWTFVHEDLDSTKLVQAIEVRTEVPADGIVEVYVDDFDLEACAPPVSGLIMPVNKLEIITPYLALAGLVAVVSAVVVVKRRKD